MNLNNNNEYEGRYMLADVPELEKGYSWTLPLDQKAGGYLVKKEEKKEHCEILVPLLNADKLGWVSNFFSLR